MCMPSGTAYGTPYLIQDVLADAGQQEHLQLCRCLTHCLSKPGSWHAGSYPNQQSKEAHLHCAPDQLVDARQVFEQLSTTTST